MSSKNINVNSLGRTQDITPEEVRQFDRFKDCTDEQVQELVEAIKTYTHFIYNVCYRQNKSGKVIAIINESEKLKAA